MKKIYNYLHTLIQKIADDEMLLRASSVSFYILLAFFPFVIILFLLSTYISPTISNWLLYAIEVFPDEVEGIITSLVTNTEISSALIFVLVGVSVWTLSSALVTLSNSLNVFYKVKETRSYLITRLLAILWAILFLVLIVSIMVIVVFGDLILSMIYRHLGIQPHGIAFEIMGYATLYVIVTFLIAVIYKFVPNIKITFLSVIKGAATSTLLWGITSYAFSIYVNNFARYHLLYGSIAGIIILITWIYITSMVLLLGGEINSLCKK